MTAITMDFLRTMQPGEVLTVVCRDAAALDSVYRTAMEMRSREEDRARYAVSRGATTLSVVVRRWPGEGEQDSGLTRTVFKD